MTTTVSSYNCAAKYMSERAFKARDYLAALLGAEVAEACKLTRNYDGNIEFKLEAITLPMSYNEALQILKKSPLLAGKTRESYVVSNEQETLWYVEKSDGAKRICLREDYWGAFKLSFIDVDAQESVENLDRVTRRLARALKGASFDEKKMRVIGTVSHLVSQLPEMGWVRSTADASYWFHPECCFALHVGNGLTFTGLYDVAYAESDK